MNHLGKSKGKPAPRSTYNSYPFAGMTKGEHFTASPDDARVSQASCQASPAQLVTLRKLHRAVLTAVMRRQRSHLGEAFTVTSGQEAGRLIVRCWRVS